MGRKESNQTKQTGGGFKQRYHVPYRTISISTDKNYCHEAVIWLLGKILSTLTVTI